MAAIPIVFSFYTKTFSVFQIVIILFLGWTREYLILQLKSSLSQKIISTGNTSKSELF